MPHGYNFPAGWEDMNGEERNKWLTQDRACKQAMRQKTPTSDEIKKIQERHLRRQKAHPDTVTLDEWV
jgi:hypothetical protein